jgi:hypothetical protein
MTNEEPEKMGETKRARMERTKQPYLRRSIRRRTLSDLLRRDREIVPDYGT